VILAFPADDESGGGDPLRRQLRKNVHQRRPMSSPRNGTGLPPGARIELLSEVDVEDVWAFDIEG
jgi:hypothetical protein